MWSTLRRIVAHVVLVSFACVAAMQPVQAAMIGAAQVAAAENPQDRVRIAAMLERADVQARLQELGIAPQDAQARVAALTDAEAAALAGRLDSLPAGGDGIIGALLFVFVLLLITDILGLTKVYPFTHPIKR